MANITQAEAAKLKGCTPQAIANAIKRGRLLLNAKGLIDTRLRSNAVYLAIEKGTKIPAQSGRAKSVKSAVAVAHGQPARPVATPEELARLGVRLTRAEKRKKGESALDAAKIREEIEKLRIANGKARGTLVPTLTAVHAMADLGATISTHFLQLPRRMSERAIAMAKSGSSPADIETFIASEISRAISRFKDEAVARFAELIAGIDDTDDADDEEPETSDDD